MFTGAPWLHNISTLTLNSSGVQLLNVCSWDLLVNFSAREANLGEFSQIIQMGVCSPSGSLIRQWSGK